MSKKGFLQDVAKGEAATDDGFRGENANGSLRSHGTGWNKQSRFETPQAPESGPWQNRGNRTGE